METPESPDTQVRRGKDHVPNPWAVPTEADHEIARVRQEIAAKFEREYLECLGWGEEAFGSGWEPSHRHYLLDKDDEDRYRKTGEKPTPAKTVYTVKKGGERRHFTIENGEIVEHADYKDGFGSMFLEPHPTQGFEYKGKFFHYHRFSLCWAGYELYKPMSPAQLASLRATRVRKREEKAEKHWQETFPLFAQAGVRKEELEGDQPQ